MWQQGLLFLRGKYVSTSRFVLQPSALSLRPGIPGRLFFLRNGGGLRNSYHKKGQKKNENAVIFDEYNDEKDLQLLDFYNLLSEPSAAEIQKFQNDLYDKYKNKDIEIEKLLK